MKFRVALSHLPSLFPRRRKDESIRRLARWLECPHCMKVPIALPRKSREWIAVRLSTRTADSNTAPSRSRSERTPSSSSGSLIATLANQSPSVSSPFSEAIDVNADNRLFSKRFPRSSQYHPEWVLANASGGANSLWLTEWLTTALDLRPGMRVLDLGCGRAS